MVERLTPYFDSWTFRGTEGLEFKPLLYSSFRLVNSLKSKDLDFNNPAIRVLSSGFALLQSLNECPCLAQWKQIVDFLKALLIVG